MEHNTASGTLKQNGSKPKRSRPEERRTTTTFPAETGKVVEAIFKSFFDQLQKTTINIRASNAADIPDPVQKKDFETRGNVIGGYRGAYLNINPETIFDTLKSKSDKEPAKMDLDKYVNPNLRRR